MSVCYNGTDARPWPPSVRVAPCAARASGGRPDRRVTGVAMTIRSRGELVWALEHSRQIAGRGAVLFAEEAVNAMLHVPLYSQVDLTRDNLTIDSIGVAAFGDFERDPATVLLRRTLDPVAAPRTQLLAPASISAAGFGLLTVALAALIGRNGMRPASSEWARPLVRAVPTGVVLTSSGMLPLVAESIRTGYRWLLRNARPVLAEMVSRAAWIQADPASLVDAMAQSRGRPPLGGVPDSAAELFALGEDKAFTAWWECLTAPSYQQALYERVRAEWLARITEDPARPIARGNDVSGFLQWWRICRPETPSTRPGEGAHPV